MSKKFVVNSKLLKVWFEGLLYQPASSCGCIIIGFFIILTQTEDRKVQISFNFVSMCVLNKKSAWIE